LVVAVAAAGLLVGVDVVVRVLGGGGGAVVMLVK
jgi:hypothetical protein